VLPPSALFTADSFPFELPKWKSFKAPAIEIFEHSFEAAKKYPTKYLNKDFKKGFISVVGAFLRSAQISWSVCT
jgi:hypothetical protein